jgi:hypothetical protein
MLKAFSARIPIARQKTCLSLVDRIPPLTDPAKKMAESCGALKAHAVCWVKRAGFLKWRSDWNLAAEAA